MVYLVAYQFMNRTAEEMKPFYETIEKFSTFVEVNRSVCLVLSGNSNADRVYDVIKSSMHAGDCLFVTALRSADQIATTDKKVRQWLGERVESHDF